MVTLDGGVYHMFVCVPFTFDMVTLDGGVYHMFVYRLRSVVVTLDGGV